MDLCKRSLEEEVQRLALDNYHLKDDIIKVQDQLNKQMESALERLYGNERDKNLNDELKAALERNNSMKDELKLAFEKKEYYKKLFLEREVAISEKAKLSQQNQELLDSYNLS